MNNLASEKYHYMLHSSSMLSYRLSWKVELDMWFHSDVDIMAKILLFFLLIDVINGKFHFFKLQVYKLQTHKLNTFHTIKKSITMM